MITLTKTQRQYLRRSAHELKPTVQVGKHGMTPSVITSVSDELNAHELIKVKFMDFREEKRELSEQLAFQLNAVLVALIGNIAILYRQQNDPERRTIILPLG
jgi:RNA-binding protein